MDNGIEAQRVAGRLCWTQPLNPAAERSSIDHFPFAS